MAFRLRISMHVRNIIVKVKCHTNGHPNRMFGSVKYFSCTQPMSTRGSLSCLIKPLAIVAQQSLDQKPYKLTISFCVFFLSEWYCHMICALSTWNIATHIMTQILFCIFFAQHKIKKHIGMVSVWPALHPHGATWESVDGFNFATVCNNSAQDTQYCKLRATLVVLLKYGNHGNW